MPIPAAGILTIDPAHSSIGFHARHLMIAKVTGRFRTFSGMIPVEPDPEQSWAEVSVVTWNQAMETGGVLVGSQITIQADIQAIPQRSRPEKQA